MALTVLTPAVIQSDRQMRPDCKHGDVAEYAVILLKTGMSERALQMLHSIRPHGLPEALLYEAICYIGTWRSEMAIPLLEEYVSLTAEFDYRRLAGQVNLLSCLVAERQIERALVLSENLIKICQQRGLRRLHGNCLELQGSALVEAGDLQAARKPLEEAESLLKGDTGRYSLHVRKWLDYIEAARLKDSSRMLRVREKAMAEESFELVREIDVLRLRLEFDPELFAGVLFGSRNEAFRRKLLLQFKQREPAPDEKISTLPCDRLQFDLGTGELNGVSVLAPGKKLHQLAFILGTERYSNFPMGALHSKLYPGQYYDPWSAPVRIAQLATRLRRTLASQVSGLSIREACGAYNMCGQVGLILPYASLIPEAGDVLFEQLKTKLSSGPAGRDLIAKWLNLSSSSAKRFINDCLVKERLEILGQGPSTRYALKVKRTAAA